MIDRQTAVRPYRVLFLDIDDTLLDFEANARLAMKEAFATFGLPFSETAFRVFEVRNLALWKRLEKKEITKQELFRMRWQTIFGELGLDAEPDAFETCFRTELENAAIPIPGAVELVTTLSGHYRLCAASNGMLRQQVNRLKKAGMYDAMEQVFVSESVGFEKPSARFFDACFQTLGDVRPTETLLVGDSVSADIEGALRYGIPCVWFDRYLTHAEPPSGVLGTIDSLNELFGYLETAKRSD